MPIYNKDKSEYRLNRPNPLVSQQARWGDKIVLHNLEWQSVELPDQSELTPIVSDLKLIEQKIEEPKIEPIEPKPETKPKEESVNIKNIVLMHCLPATTKTIKDELYGEEKTTVSYQEKFILEGLILEQTDITFKFWTTIDLGKGTIVYPYQRKDGRNVGDFRWWKVNSTESKSEGFIISCIMSGYQPHFS